MTDASERHLANFFCHGTAVRLFSTHVLGAAQQLCDTREPCLLLHFADLLLQLAAMLVDMLSAVCTWILSACAQPAVSLASHICSLSGSAYPPTW